MQKVAFYRAKHDLLRCVLPSFAKLLAASGITVNRHMSRRRRQTAACPVNLKII